MARLERGILPLACGTYMDNVGAYKLIDHAQNLMGNSPDPSEKLV